MQGGDEPARVEGEEGLGFVVGVYFDVLVGDVLFFECDPDALDEGAKPTRVEFEGVIRGVGLYDPVSDVSDGFGVRCGP